MNIETVITITHFSVSVKQLIGFLRACIWLPADLLLVRRNLFSTLAPQLLEYLASRELTFGQLAPLLPLAAQTSSRQTTAEQILTHSKLKTAAINQQVHHQRKRAHTGSFSQIVSILGEVKLVNIYIRYSWHLGSH